MEGRISRGVFGGQLGAQWNVRPHRKASVVCHLVDLLTITSKCNTNYKSNIASLSRVQITANYRVGSFFFNERKLAERKSPTKTPV